ncbi:phage holin family protein [Rouxiella chamberiensis]|uniref:Phage holin family protein n=1 Tax=Rouxiella chamberiensis TaxID=1513468 RepID=A0ABY7HUS1_9GAMM|nr:phage holin family protein [Rouxiella chamberiensis]WAT03120.1 phage holin family protein [Rouxiella chamberiensis]
MFDSAQRIVTIMVGMVETRLRLIVVELEEEKANLFQLLLMACITLIFTAFGLMSLLVVLFFAIDPAYRLTAMATTTAVLLLLAVILGAWTLGKARRSTLLSASRRQLKIDRALLDKDEQDE